MEAPGGLGAFLNNIININTNNIKYDANNKNADIDNENFGVNPQNIHHLTIFKNRV